MTLTGEDFRAIWIGIDLVQLPLKFALAQKFFGGAADRCVIDGARKLLVEFSDPQRCLGMSEQAFTAHYFNAVGRAVEKHAVRVRMIEAHTVALQLWLC